MRTLPTDDHDQIALAKLNAEPWMVECLALNPEYVHWGPGEDYMSTKGDGWGASKVFPTWTAFGPWSLDELNEIVHFYFAVERDAEKCTLCDGDGLNPATHQISESFYDFDETGQRWCENITQDEVDALQEQGRLRTWDREKKEWSTTPLTAAEVNAANRRRGLGDLSHDAINRWILIETRAKRLGVYGKCDACKGDGYIFTAPAAHLELTLWFLHPRKGAARGVRVEHVEQNELPTVFALLNAAAKQNADRFRAVQQKVQR
jgi:hypothetical protein